MGVMVGCYDACMRSGWLLLIGGAQAYAACDDGATARRLGGGGYQDAFEPSSGCPYDFECEPGETCLEGRCEPSLGWGGGGGSSGCRLDGARTFPFESDVDCGGPCPPCAVGQRCFTNLDCQSGRCAQGECVDPSCQSDLECPSLRCERGSCAAPTCDDGVQNDAEEGVDCGGPCKASCPAFDLSP